VQRGSQGPVEDEGQHVFFDRYKRDKGKSVDIAGITMTDQFRGEFHRQGLDQEVDCVGSFNRRLKWTAGGSIPTGQLHVPGGRV